MKACKATSAEANGTRVLPCSSVNNAFGTNLQFFKGMGGLGDVALEPNCWPLESLAPTAVLKGANDVHCLLHVVFFILHLL